MRLAVYMSLVAAIVVFAPVAFGQVFSPWVNSEHTPDFRDPVRFGQFAAWKDLKDQDLAVAVWKYLTDPVTGTYHFTDMYELPKEPYWEVKLVQDPMKILNVYGFAVCNMHTSMVCGLYKGMGFEDVRLAGWEQYHATPEVFWDGGWHYIDVDERAYILDDKGNVASAADVYKHPEWWEPSSKTVRPFYPQNGGLRGVQTMAKHGPPEYCYNWYDGGYAPDFVLKPGEKVERFFGPQGHWRVPSSYLEGGTREIVSHEPSGPKSGGFSENSYGNARFDYEPVLGSDAGDYEKGVWADRNVELSKSGLVLKTDGTGFSTFYFQYPYIVVPQVGDLGDVKDDRDACVVRFRGGANTALKVSLDHGNTWQGVSESAPAGSVGIRTVDLTPQVAGKYAFWLRFEYAGKKGEMALESLSMSTWTQLAPISLPRLKAGQNRLTYGVGDKYGLNTWVVPIDPDCGDIDQLKPYLYGRYDYDAQRRRDRFRGPVTFKLDAPEGSLIEWLHTSVGLFVEYEKGKRVESGDRIEVALDRPEDFRPLWKAQAPDWVSHWYFRGQAEYRLPRPANTVYVRVVPKSGLLNVAFYLHVSRPGEANPKVEITHKFIVNGREQTVSNELARAGSYSVTCEAEPKNVSITYRVPTAK